MNDYLKTNGDRIQATQSITVIVTECTATINTSLSKPTDVFYHRWGSKTVSTRFFQPFTVTAGCTLTFTYTAKIRIDANTLADLPANEITFKASQKQFLIQKCNSFDLTSFEADPECTGDVTPYFKPVYTVVIVGTLNNSAQTKASVSFKVTIGPDCDNDMVTFGAPSIPNQLTTNYNGKLFLGINSAYEMKLYSHLNQIVENCPKNCQLFSLVSSSPVDRFVPETGDLILKTNDSRLNGQVLDFRIDCISTLSKAQSVMALSPFSVAFEFENCHSVISLNSAKMQDQTQSWLLPGRNTTAIPEFAYVADCELQFSYSAFVREGTGSFMPIESVKEIKFDP